MSTGGFSDDADDDVRGAPAPDGDDLTAGTPKNEYDDVPGDAPPPDETDPVAAELGAVFAAALADEPESAVTPMSVLHAVREGREQRTAVRWSREWVAWKWGGGLAVAAAAVAAVFIVGSSLGTHDASSTAGAASGASTGASAAAAGDSGQPTAALPAQSAGGSSAESGAPALGLVPPNSTGPSGSEKAQDSSGQAADSAAGAGSGTAGGAGTTSESGESYAAAPSESVPCAAPPLTESEWDAAIGALSENIVIPERFAAGCGTAAWRAGMLEVGSSQSAIEILVGAVGEYPAGLVPSLGDRQLGPSVTASRGGTIVVVTVSANSVTLVSHAQLVAVAEAVLAAAH
ncbi:MAG: hypothetical protein BGO26_14575 [Actinobacteria bacterium 69-20]|nr:MAG: hypothetical protein BGO26_14575 [Actinobacteria bacterium 69-20]